MRQVISEFKLQTGYLKYRKDLGRKETWQEAVSERVMGMHRLKFMTPLDEHPKLKEYFDFAEQAYLDKLVLGSQRALQFGGDPILRKNSKMYNCLTSYCDRVPFFKESMWWLLSGCGVGFSVLKQYIDKLPELKVRDKGTKTYVVQDSIEGWADAVGCLMSSYFREDKSFGDYYGYDIKFDLSNIRAQGSPISSGFKAPGPDPLKRSLQKIEDLINDWIVNQGTKVRPILAYDIVMHASDAVLAGGVRRSATICIFGKDDLEMRYAKTGNWYVSNPQRARSNNSVALLRSETSKEEFLEIMKSVEQFGEPGFVWLDDERIVYNPCVEIGMIPALNMSAIHGKGEPGQGEYADVWLSGWQGCNLTEINGGACNSEKVFLRACKASAILGTLQAAYTSFEYVGKITEAIFEKEALLGCSITGWMNNPDILFDKDILAKGVALIKEINEEVAEMIGINPAARLTCSKPSGNASVILGCASGIKPEESRRYIRYIQVNPDEYGVEQFANLNPKLIEDSVWDANGNDYAIGFAVENEGNPFFKNSMYGVSHLEYVRKAIDFWVEPGTVVERCTIPEVRHNVSCTVNVDDWDKVSDYIYENRYSFAGISFLAMDGSLEYNQAPFAEVLSLTEISDKYGEGSLLASGLIVDGLHAFDDDLWRACMYVIDKNLKLEGTRTEVFLKRDWIRRAKQFAKNYFKRDVKLMTYCLKDVHRFYRYKTIEKSYKPMNWKEYREKETEVDVSTLGAIACSGGQCEI